MEERAEALLAKTKERGYVTVSKLLWTVPNGGVIDMLFGLYVSLIRLAEVDTKDIRIIASENTGTMSSKEAMGIG